MRKGRVALPPKSICFPKICNMVSFIRMKKYPKKGQILIYVVKIRRKYKKFSLKANIYPWVLCLYDLPFTLHLITVILHIIWAPSSEFVSSSIPSWQILTAHAQPFRGARDLAFCLKVPLDSMLVWASSGGSGETARMRRLAWTSAARIGDKYQIRLTQPIWAAPWQN